jgi:hypothetical protein
VVQNGDSLSVFMVMSGRNIPSCQDQQRQNEERKQSRPSSDVFDRREPLIVNQSQKPFAGSFLVTLRAGPFRPVAGRSVKNRRGEGLQRVELMPMRSRQARFDTVVDACQVRAIVHSRTIFLLVR